MPPRPARPRAQAGAGAVRGPSALAMQRPTSFALLGMYLGIRALTSIGLLVGPDADLATDRTPPGVTLLVAVFAAVAAEALWRCRPWCVRATVGYFAASILAPLAATAVAGRLMPGEVMFSIIGRVMIAALPVLYVQSRAKQLFAPPPARVAVPLPRPQP